MCGICGIWNYRSRQPVDQDLLQKMTRSMIHRGPDDEGFYYDDEAGMGLGFRRLSIIDLSPTGHQPMSNETGSVWIVFNGEIYNYLSLRPGLEKKGHIFRSQSDTEVILHQYEEQKSGCIQALAGMFGLAIWDRDAQSLLLARDRVGKKPLYYYDDGSRILFASELKAILADRSVPRGLNPEALVEYLGIGYIDGDKSIFANVHKLPAGHFLVKSGGQTSIQQYWSLLPSFEAEEKNVPEQEWQERLMELLKDAVRSRMISDVPLGAFLSGGVDSSTVVALMAQSSNRKVKTFSIGFEDEPFSELKYAQMVAQRFETEHHEYIVKPDSISQILPRLVADFDEPFADPSALPTYYVARVARQDVTVCLTGDGGDEALAGYTRYATAGRHSWIYSIPASLRKGIFSLPARLVSPAGRTSQRLNHLMASPDERYQYDLEVFSPGRERYLLSPDYARLVPDFPNLFSACQAQAARLPFLSRMQYLDINSYLSGDILVKVDRTSMLNSLETRCPFLDHRVLELAAHMPAGLRLNGGQGKYVLKNTMRGLLPDAVLDRPKMGFGIPGHRWLVEESDEFVRDLLSERALINRGILRPEQTKEIITRSLATPRDSYQWSRAWALLVLELWCRTYLDA